MHVRLVHEFDATPAEFWRVFFHEPYNLALWDRLKVKEWKVLAWKEDADTIYRSIRVIPARDLPAVLKKIVKGDLGYTETSTFYRAKDSMDVTVVPTLMGDRTSIQGRYFVEVLPGGRLRRTFEANMEVKVPLVGGAIERAIYEDMQKSYDLAAEVTQEWINKNRAAT